LLAVSIGWNYFLLGEARKKFGLAGQYIKTAKNTVTWQYEGSEKDGRIPGMWNIVLISRSPFSALIGFELEALNGFLDGWDVFGVAHSTPNDVGMHQIVIRTYLGNNPTKFEFLTDIPSDAVVATSSFADQDLEPTKVFPPHWWQRLGLYS